MTLQQLSCFAAVAETGSVTRAAEQLHIAQPSLSAALAKLERELEVSLFDRPGRRLVLTAEGEEFLKYAKRILEESQRAEDAMRAAAARRRGSISIGCATMLFEKYLPQHMAEFTRTEGARADIRFNEAGTAMLVQDMKRGIYDFLLCSRTDDPELEEHVILRQPLMLVCPWDSPVLLKNWKQLESLPLVGFHESSAMSERTDRLLREKNLTVNLRCRLPNDTSIAAFVQSGLGYAVVADTPMLQSFHIRRMPLPGEEYREAVLAKVKGRSLYPAAKRFYEFLLANSEP